MYDSKKKEIEKKDKISDMITKDTVKKDDEEKEEKPDTRGMYAKINLIKNKLRAAGQRDPIVMAVDACEEKVEEGRKPPMDARRMAEINRRNKDNPPTEKDEKSANDFYNSIMKKPLNNKNKKPQSHKDYLNRNK